MRLLRRRGSLFVFSSFVFSSDERYRSARSPRCKPSCILEFSDCPIDRFEHLRVVVQLACLLQSRKMTRIPTAAKCDGSITAEYIEVMDIVVHDGINDFLVILIVQHEDPLKVEFLRQKLKERILGSSAFQDMFVTRANYLAYITTMNALTHHIPDLLLSTWFETLVIEQDAAIQIELAGSGNSACSTRLHTEPAIWWTAVLRFRFRKTWGRIRINQERNQDHE